VIAMKNDSLLVVNNLKKYFPTRTKGLFVKAIDGIDLNIKQGDTVGLVGESGSGKSTTAYVIVGMYNPTSGKIIFNGTDISGRKRPLSIKKEIQIVFQDPGTSLNPSQRVNEILSLPLKIHRKIRGKALKDAILHLLEEVNLPIDYYYKHPGELGGGEKQLIAIARALASNPSFIVFDEPTSALDVSIQAKIIHTLQKIKNDSNLSYLFITHDMSLIRNIANKVAVMYLGKIVEIGRVEDIFSHPAHPYTRMLLSSIPVVTSAEEEIRPKGIKSIGEIESPVNIPSGCRFRTRCPLAMDICSKEEPPATIIGQDHIVRCHLFSQQADSKEDKRNV
jgi:peptide/nickel transport system ATP-binding protein